MIVHIPTLEFNKPLGNVSYSNDILSIGVFATLVAKFPKKEILESMDKWLYIADIINQIKQEDDIEKGKYKPKEE